MLSDFTPGVPQAHQGVGNVDVVLAEVPLLKGQGALCKFDLFIGIAKSSVGAANPKQRVRSFQSVHAEVFPPKSEGLFAV